MYDPIEDFELMRDIAGRNAAALESLYDRYEQAIYSYAYRMVGEAMLAEEVVQELFMRIWNSAERFEPGHGKLTTWMFAITRNIAIDFLRKRQNRTRKQTAEVTMFEQLPDPGTDIEEAVAMKLTGERVKEALKELNAEQQQVVELIYYQGYTHQEVSEHHGIPLGTVKSRIRLAMKQLKNRLADLERIGAAHERFTE